MTTVREQQPTTTPADDELEAALEVSGFAWSRRDAGWAVPVGENVPREIRVGRVGDHVRAEAVLAEWENLERPSRAALAAFVARVPVPEPARLGLDAGGVRAHAVAAGDELEAGLPGALAAVAAACRLAVREVKALQNADAARAYLEFHGIAATGPEDGETAG